MSAVDAFFDTNVVLYLLSADDAKANKAESLLAAGGNVSVQVLNELVAVARGKLHMPWADVLDIVATVRSLCAVCPLSLAVHERGLEIARQMNLSVYDSMIVAAALVTGCRTLYSEDLQDGRVVAKQLTIRNPFRRSDP